MRSSKALMALALVGALAHAEGVDSRQELPSTTARLHGVTTLKLMPGGGLLSMGGSSLRMLAPGARGWTTLHRQVGDNLYRVAVDDSGRVLAAWEEDPSIHYFSPGQKQHLTLPKPAAPSPDLYRFRLESLELLPNGRDALVHMEGERLVDGKLLVLKDGKWRKSHPVSSAFRVPLDGKSAPELLYQVEGGRPLHITPKAAVYVLPARLEQTCEHRTCAPVAAIVAYEVTEKGVSQRTLLSADQVAMSNARLVDGSNDDRTVLELDLEGRERALLRWRHGDAEPSYRPFTWARSDPRLMVTSTDEVIELVRGDGGLVIRRYPPNGGEQVITLAGSKDPNTVDTSVHDLGERSDGSLWLHWGDHLILLPPGKPARGYSIEPLLTRRSEWASVDIYLKDPEILWVGMEVGRGRDFLRVSFAEIEKRAQPWPKD